jgi:hypothetical protein
VTKVFIGGSRTLSRLTAELRDRLDGIVAKGFPVVVGDANGADKAVQTYLHAKGYREVEVFCSGDEARNNVGEWPLRHIDAEGARDRREHFTFKDRAMAREAALGFMLWDGESLGTLLNVVRLIAKGKKALVYMSTTRTFTDVTSKAELDQIVARLSPATQKKLDDLLSREPEEALVEEEGPEASGQLKLAI